jgi:dTDP-glucose pyrophosphorylase
VIRDAVVLAAGRGRRLRPLTDHLPKPLVTVGAGTLIDSVLAGVAEAGVASVTVVVGYRSGDVIDHLRGAGWITFVHQDEPLGSGHALRLCRSAVGDSPFLLAWSDIVTDPADYATVATAFTEDTAAVVGVVAVDDISAGGAVVFGADGSVTGVVEKPPGTPPSLWNSAGIMALGPHIWPHLDELAPSVRGELEFTDALASLVASGEKVRAVKLRGPWFDVGSRQSLDAARASWGQG